MNSAYFFDIDGTIYDSEFHKIHPQFFVEAKKLLEGGDDVYLLSSRAFEETVHLPEEIYQIPFSAVILDGGASVYDDHLNLAESRSIEKEKMEQMKEYCDRKGVNWRYAGKDGCFFHQSPEPEIRELWRHLYLMVPETKEWEGDPVSNLLIFTHDPEVIGKVRSIFTGSALVVYENCIEIRAAGVSKEDSVRKLRAQRGYEKVICAGDGENDVPMLALADLAVSVENGCANAKKQADVIVPSPKEGGVALWLESRRKKKDEDFL